MAHTMCRFCTNQDIKALAKTYAGVVVGDLENTVQICEQEYAACCTTWCSVCERVSIVCMHHLDGGQSGIAAQIALWKQVSALEPE
jgi:hypothetical protein